MSNLVRYFAIAEMSAIVIAGAYLYYYLFWYRQDWFVRSFALVTGYIGVMVALAIFVNTLTPIPPTPGVKLFAVAIFPAVVAVVALIWFSRNRTTR